MKVIQIIPTLGLAGAEIMCENLSNALTQQGIDTIVVSLYNCHSAISERLEQQGIRVIYFDKKMGADFGIVAELYRLFKKERPDAVHTHLYALKYVTPAAMLAGVKRRVHTVHNIAAKEATPAAQKINYFLYHRCNVIPVALSEEVCVTIHDRYRLPVDRIPIVFNGVDFSKCIIKENYTSGETLKFLHIGRFSAQKNHRMLLEAFAEVHTKLSASELQLIGTGELENDVKKQAEALGLQDCVTFLGQIDNVYPYLNEADVFVLPSNYEGMPMTLIEAMGTGLPIVTTKVGGIPTMLEHRQEGLVVDVSVESIAAAMLQMVSEKERERLGRAANQKAHKSFSAQSMCEGYRRLYGEEI